MLPSVAHNWYSWARRACPDSPFPLWHSAAYHHGARSLHQQAGACVPLEGPSRPRMAVAGPSRELRKGGFFSQELQIVYFLGKLATESTWLAQQNPAARHSVRAAVGEVLVCETTIKMWQSFPQTRWLQKVPVVEKSLVKRNYCSGALETGWLWMRPSLWGALCCDHGAL